MFLAAIPAQAAGGSNGRADPHVFRVLDKRGKLVGYTVTENMVAREIDGVWVTFYVHPVDRAGIFNSEAIYLHYLTTDCSGTAYVTHYSTFSEGTRVGPKLYYPTDQQQLNPRSLRVAREDGFGDERRDRVVRIRGSVQSRTVDGASVSSSGRDPPRAVRGTWALSTARRIEEKAVELCPGGDTGGKKV
ncbi:MAG: hypothetical protein DMF55_13330 [Acidobacteria bacterium]|nr:MAG: hypothetical protein DMF55_13330 [Acidobacteriota bacterium]